MKLTATSLRRNIYAILDQILATGEAVEIERNGRTLRLQVADSGSRLDGLTPRSEYINGDPHDLVEFDWAPSIAAHHTRERPPASRRTR